MERDPQPETRFIEALAARVSDTSYSDLPADVVDHISVCIRDLIGVTIAGSASDTGTKAIECFSGLHPGSPGEATVVGSDERLPLLEAVFVNGLAAHALDYDDSTILLPGHPSVVLVPPILGLGETRDASGREAVTAYAVGFEAMVALSRPISPRHYDNGWHSTGTIGTFGATAAAASVLGLDGEAVERALNIAASFSSGIRTNFGTMTKPAHAGQASRSGATAALLASNGFTADDGAITGAQGFFELYDGYDRPDPDAFPEVTEEWHATADGIDLKKYPACYRTHTGIAATEELVEAHSLVADDVEQITVRGAESLRRVVCDTLPTTGLEGKFSIRHAVAAAFLYDLVGLEAFTDDAVTDREARLLQKRTRVEIDSDMEPHSLVLTVEIRTDSGETYASTVEHPPGRPENPLSAEERYEKFSDCARTNAAVDEPDRIYDAVSDLPTQDSLRDLAQRL